MPLSYVKETIEINSFETDENGEALIVRKINLKEGQRRQLVQVDLFEDAIPFTVTGNEVIQLVVSAYPSVPTDMRLASNPPIITDRLVSAGDDSVLFKAIGDPSPQDAQNRTSFDQFPSVQIAAANAAVFYSDQVYITLKWDGAANTAYGNIALSFLFVFKETSVNNLTATLGKMAEQHDAMCALVMSTGHMTTSNILRGNTFPMWRYGGIRPEHTISPTATNSFFLEIDTRDAETMSDTAQIRQAVADARGMSAFDQAMGDRRPDWMKLELNQGIIAGAIRSDPVPLKFADNGNTLMF
tara:strand:+ start:698 stop:1594 length:897 start_codon:yes stop_codon:yes gene_type:complete